jgi:hypothetical protein
MIESGGSSVEEREGDERDPDPVSRFTETNAAYGTVTALANVTNSTLNLKMET